MTRSRHLLAIAVIGVGACHGGSSEFTTTTTSTTSSTGPSSTGMTVDPTTSGSSGSTATSSTTSSSGSTSEASSGDASSTTLVLDVGSDKDLGDGTPAGCKGKIDFLFVISGDQNMDFIQARLVDAFPKFIDTIASKFEDFDYHIMVVDADDYWGIPWMCTAVCPDLSCKSGDPCCPYDSPKGKPCCPAPDYPCGDLGLVTACDETLGAGTIFPAGLDSSNEPCKVDGARRYLAKGETDLVGTFGCMAQIGITGGNQIGAALAAAVGPEINALGGCNDGFLRDDALLMVTLVSPGADDSDTGTVEEWYQALVAAKHGDPAAIVMFLIGNPECPDYDLSCALAKSFSYVLVESGYAEDLGPAFGTASSLVESACYALVPQ